MQFLEDLFDAIFEWGRIVFCVLVLGYFLYAFSVTELLR